MFFYTFMPKLFNMSLTASAAIALVILLRLLLKKAPKVILISSNSFHQSEYKLNPSTCILFLCYLGKLKFHDVIKRLVDK